MTLFYHPDPLSFTLFSFLFTTKDFDSHYFEMKPLPWNIKHLSKFETKRNWFVKCWPANVWFKKTDTIRSSNTLLWIVSVFLNLTLAGQHFTNHNHPHIFDTYYFCYRWCVLHEDTLMTVKAAQKLYLPSWFCFKWLYVLTTTQTRTNS